MCRKNREKLYKTHCCFTLQISLRYFSCFITFCIVQLSGVSSIQHTESVLFLISSKFNIHKPFVVIGLELIRNILIIIIQRNIIFVHKKHMHGMSHWNEMCIIYPSMQNRIQIE